MPFRIVFSHPAYDAQIPQIYSVRKAIFFYHQSDAKAASDALTTRLQLKNLLNQTAVRKSRHDTELLPDIGDFGIVGIMTMCNVIDRCVIHERFQAFHVVTG